MVSESSEIHDFDNTVVAILDAEPEVAEATARLSAAGYNFEVLRGDSGREHLDASGEKGLWATLKRMATTFGDQKRIFDRLDRALEEGRLVVSVETDPSQAHEAVGILKDHGGEYLWKFGSWTFTRVGD